MFLGTITHGVATGLITVLLPSTVTLLPGLHHSVPTYGLLGFSEAPLAVPGLGVEDAVDLTQRARRKLVVVPLVSRCGSDGKINK